MFTIQKSVRANPSRQDSYSGPTWDVAGIRHMYKEHYDSFNEAKEIAETLSRYNKVGFSVVEFNA